MKTQHKRIHCCNGKLYRCEQHINQCNVIWLLTASSSAFPADQSFCKAKKSENWQEPFFSISQTPWKRQEPREPRRFAWTRRWQDWRCPLARTTPETKGTGPGAEVIELPQLNNCRFSAALQQLLAKVMHTKIVYSTFPAKKASPASPFSCQEASPDFSEPSPLSLSTFNTHLS